MTRNERSDDPNERSDDPHRERRGSNDEVPIVQLLVADEGNRDVIGRMLEGTFSVVTDGFSENADIYLVEDRLLDRHRDSLWAEIRRQDPVFCPVVLIRRPETEYAPEVSSGSLRDGPLLVDEFVDAPIEPSVLTRRLRSLLARRRQSIELQEHIADLRARERDLSRFEEAVTHTGNGIVVTDREGTIDIANPAFERLAGYDAESLAGRSLGVIEPEDGYRAFDGSFWETVRSRGVWEGEITVERADGTHRFADVTVRTIGLLDETEGAIDRSDERHVVTGGHDDRVEGFVAVFTDISERIQREELLQQRENDLDLLREILTRYLRHNIRNELNVIGGYARLLEERLSGADAAYAEIIAETTDRLSRTSETARQYSSLIDQKNELFRQDLPELLREIVADVSNRYPDVAFDVDVSDAGEIYSTIALRVALEELIENAASHNTADDPRVDIRVRSGDGIRVSIEDNGPGIANEELAAIRQDRETPLIHGSGVGLWLSKWAIEGLGGQLSFDTGTTGTRAIVELPPTGARSREAVDVSTLHEREQRLQTLIDRMTDAVLEVDANWRVTFVDPRAAEIAGKEPEAILDRMLWDAFPAVDDTPFEELFRKAMETRTATSLESYYPETDGWLEVYVYPDFGGGLSLYIRDVTEQYERERELRDRTIQLRGVLDSVDAVIWMRDPDSRFLLVNQRFRELFGLPDELDVVGRTLEDIFSEEMAGQFHENDRIAWEQRETIELEETVSVEDGERTYLTHITPLFDDSGAPYATCGIATDITDHKRTEWELEERLKELHAVHETAELFAGDHTSTPELLTELASAIPGWFQYPTIAEAKIVYDDIEVSTAEYPANHTAAGPSDDADTPPGNTTVNVYPRDRRLSIKRLTNREIPLWIDVVYTEDRPAEDHGPFLEEERSLLETITTFVSDDLERRAYLSDLERLQTLFSETERLGNIGAWELSPSGELHLTDGARRILELEDETVDSFEAVLELVHSDDRSAVRSVFDTGASSDSGISQDIEIRLDGPTDEERRVLIRGRSIADGSVRGCIQDVTDR